MNINKTPAAVTAIFALALTASCSAPDTQGTEDLNFLEKGCNWFFRTNGCGNTNGENAQQARNTSPHSLDTLSTYDTKAADFAEAAYWFLLNSADHKKDQPEKLKTVLQRQENNLNSLHPDPKPKAMTENPEIEEIILSCYEEIPFHPNNYSAREDTYKNHATLLTLCAIETAEKSNELTPEL